VGDSQLHMSYPLEGLKGADYNPRRIGDDAIERLQRSLRTIGVCKPIIARGKTIVAGHQRTRALRGMGRWFYQKFHSQADLDRICREMGWKRQALTTQEVAWQMVVENGPAVDHTRAMAALSREFNMLLSSRKRRLGRDQHIKEAIKCCL
jgi:hypothetical protein